jgi:hypothetical protein
MLLTLSDQLIKYGMWPASILVLCLVVLIAFRKKIGPIFDKIGPAIDRVRKAGPIELTSAPPSQQPIDVRAESPPKIFHPLTLRYLTIVKKRFGEKSRNYFRAT